MASLLAKNLAVPVADLDLGLIDFSCVLLLIDFVRYCEPTSTYDFQFSGATSSYGMRYLLHPEDLQAWEKKPKKDGLTLLEYLRYRLAKHW